MRKVIQMSQRQISGNGEEKSMSLQEVFLVNHSPSQAKERERMITAISGLTCSGPYIRSGPIGSLVRTLLASSRWYSPVRRLKWEVNPLYSERVSLYLKDDSNMLLKPFAVILNAKDIPSSRYLYRLVPSVHLTDGIEFGLLPAAPVGKAYGKIPFSLVLKMHFLACFPCDFRQDASFFEISQQDRVRQRINAYLPVAGSLRFRLPGRGCYRTESSRKMSLYRFKRIRDILRLLKLHRQGDDVPSLSDAEIVS